MPIEDAMDITYNSHVCLRNAHTSCIDRYMIRGQQTLWGTEITAQISLEKM